MPGIGCVYDIGVGRTLDYTVAFRDLDRTVDLFKIMLGGDGSYYVTMPYHPLNRAWRHA